MNISLSVLIWSLFILVVVSAEWKIINGSRTIMNEYPQIVSIKYSNEHICGGTLLNGNSVLTAAHCIYLLKRLSPQNLIDYDVQVVLNEYDLESLSGREKVFHVNKIILHPTYTEEMSYLNGNDVAIIKFNGYIPNSEIEYVKFHQNQSVDLDVRCEVVGWGSTLPSGDGNSRFLQKAVLNIISNDECSDSFEYMPYVVSNFCAGSGRYSTNACLGDSGGPLFCKDGFGENIQVGIVSYGLEPCGQPNVPTVFTKIFEVSQWIALKAQQKN